MNPSPHSPPSRSSGDPAHPHVAFEASPGAHGSSAANTPVPEQSQVDEILRRKRKSREYKACYPCRSRKVRCDQQVPCRTCVVRNHPELCTYHPPSDGDRPAKRANTKSNGFNSAGDDTITPSTITYTSSSVVVPRDEWSRICAKLNAAEKNLTELRQTLGGISDGSNFRPSETAPPRPSPPVKTDHDSRHLSIEGIHTHNELTGETVHIGGSSVPALVMALGPEGQEMLGKSILPIFGLDNESATYPFVDLWGMPHGSLARVQQVCKLIPSDPECLRFFRSYRDTAHVVYPAIVDIEKLEQDLLLFLINRVGMQNSAADNGGISEQRIFGKKIIWVGMLFAAFASGCQCSDMPRRERELTSQVFVCCSFECLRLTNFLSNPTVESIQTLLVLGNVISNNMNAGVAWSLLGLTVRLSQTLGLHRACLPSAPLAVKNVRSKVWWAVLWQDGLLSITFDRASSAATLDRPAHFPPGLNSQPGSRSYVECMYRLCKVTLDIVRERADPQGSHAMIQRITERRQELEDIQSEAADYLRDVRRCRSTRDRIEHWALHLHASYVTSELCRPAISPTAPDTEPARRLRQVCVASLHECLEAFLGLNKVSVFGQRSWAAVHRSLSSAILLGLLREPARSERTRQLIAQMIAVLAQMASSVDAAEVSQPIKRSLVALRKLNVPRPGARGDASLEAAAAAASGYAPTAVGEASETGAGIARSTSETTGTDPALDFLNGLSFDDSPIWGNSPNLNLDTESPYALMDSILWGAQRTPSVGS